MKGKFKNFIISYFGTILITTTVVFFLAGSTFYIYTKKSADSKSEPQIHEEDPPKITHKEIDLPTEEVQITEQKPIEPVITETQILAEAINDSRMSRDTALQGVSSSCPQSILNLQTVVTVQYYSFDGKLHQGQLVVDKRLKNDVEKIFRLIKDTKFPVESVIPISASQFNWDDDNSMRANNTSGFNYRTTTGGSNLSKHAYGFAIDINPRMNPYIHNGITEPSNGSYDTSKNGTLYSSHPVVKKFKELGWTWGGDWRSIKDYQHFQKAL